MVWNGIVVDCKTDWVRVSISNVLLLLLLGLECDMRNIYHILFFCFPLFFFIFLLFLLMIMRILFYFSLLGLNGRKL